MTLSDLYTSCATLHPEYYKLRTMKKIIALLILFYSIDSFSQSFEKHDDNLIYNMAGLNVKPEFPEGLLKLNSDINENLRKVGFGTETEKKTRANTRVKEKPKTKIYTMFVVEKDGSLSDIKVLGKVDSRKAEELIRILKNLPKWNPGKQNGIIVRVLYPLTIDRD